MPTRADAIVEILEKAEGNRMKVAAITETLRRLEVGSLLNQSSVSVAAIQDNKAYRNQGKTPRFNTYGDGTEERGFLSLRQSIGPRTIDDLGKSRDEIFAIIEDANQHVREQLMKEIEAIEWREFESNFLTRILEALGFHSIEITKPTSETSLDAYCQYTRGIVASEAIVSAKHWKANRVGPDEVQRLRGIRGNADTAVIVTTSAFTEQAKKEAEPGQNQRAVVLVDGDLIVDTCLATSIGVRSTNLPTLFGFVGFKPKTSEEEEREDDF